jgi:hypothetical protein
MLDLIGRVMVEGGDREGSFFVWEEIVIVNYNYALAL